jgi:hypothetical protein
MKASQGAIVDNWWKRPCGWFSLPNGLLMFGKTCAIFRKLAVIWSSASRRRIRAETVGFAILMRKTTPLSIGVEFVIGTTARGVSAPTSDLFRV